MVSIPLAGQTFAQALGASEEIEWHEERVHSDLPIYTFDYEELWPRSYIPEDAIAGCYSRVSFGDWKFTPNRRNEYGNEWWMRVRNYGVFHCGALISKADTPDEVSEAHEQVGFFVRLGEEDAEEPQREFWVLQEGLVPGSDYVLLTREFDEELATAFTVLQRRCPIGAYRSVLGMDVWLTGYCAINSHEDLLRLSEEMASLPPLGELVLQKDPEAEGAAGSN